jgi:hypothetical protein
LSTSSGSQSNFLHEEPASRESGYSGQINAEILWGDFVAHLTNHDTDNDFHLFNGDPLSRASMCHPPVSRPMGDEIVRADVPLAEPLRPKGLWIRPDSRVMIGAVKIKKHPVSLPERVIPPGKLGQNTASYQWMNG